MRPHGAPLELRLLKLQRLPQPAALLAQRRREALELLPAVPKVGRRRELLGERVGARAQRRLARVGVGAQAALARGGGGALAVGLRVAFGAERLEVGLGRRGWQVGRRTRGATQ